MICQICGKMGHPTLQCWHRFNNSYQYEDVPVALVAMKITDVTEHQSQEWFPDSSALAHITNNHQNLQHSQSYHGSESVMIVDGNFLPITHTSSTSFFIM